MHKKDNYQFSRRAFVQKLSISGTSLLIICFPFIDKIFAARSLQLESAQDVLQRHGYSYSDIFKNRKSFERIEDARDKGIYDELQAVISRVQRESGNKLTIMRKIGRELALFIKRTPKNNRTSTFIAQRERYKKQILIVGGERKELNRKIIALNALMPPQ